MKRNHAINPGSNPGNKPCLPTTNPFCPDDGHLCHARLMATQKRMPRRARNRPGCLLTGSVGDHGFGEIERYPSWAKQSTLHLLRWTQMDIINSMNTDGHHQLPWHVGMTCPSMKRRWNPRNLKCVQIPADSIFEANQQDVELSGVMKKMSLVSVSNAKARSLWKIGRCSQRFSLALPCVATGCHGLYVALPSIMQKRILPRHLIYLHRFHMKTLLDVAGCSC